MKFLPSSCWCSRVSGGVNVGIIVEDYAGSLTKPWFRQDAGFISSQAMRESRSAGIASQAP